MKPRSFNVYTEDKRENEFDALSQALKLVLPAHIYTVVHLTPSVLINHSSISENCACLIVCNLELIKEHAWNLIKQYCSREAAKALFFCSAAPSNDVTTQIKDALTKIIGYSLEKWPADNDYEKIISEAQKGKETRIYLKRENCAKTDILDTLIIAKDESDEQPLFCLQHHKSKDTSVVLANFTVDEAAPTNTIFLPRVMQKLGFYSTNEPSTSITQIPELASGYLICKEDGCFKDQTNFEFGHHYGKEPELVFYKTISFDNNKRIELPITTPHLFPIEERSRADGLPVKRFKSEKYFQALKTEKLGHVLVFAPVCETSLTISRSLSIAFPNVEGILVVPESQTRGRGRNSTYEWISPIGCAMPTFNYLVAFDSEFAKCLDFLEHVLTVSIVDAIKSLLKDENFPLHIKWPNDIYYKRLCKMGGVLVNVHKEEKRFACIAGAGINVANSKPIGCINDWLPKEKKLCVEEVVAEVMNKFEYYSNKFVETGRSSFLEKYYEYWLHTNEEVALKRQGSDDLERVKIQGIDSMGNLEVMSIESGQVYSLKDDNNSLDLAKGIIHPRS